MKIEELIGKRILVAIEYQGYGIQTQKVEEFKILEVSPSGEWTKIMDRNGSKFWKGTKFIQPIEILKFDERPNP